MAVPWKILIAVVGVTSISVFSYLRATGISSSGVVVGLAARAVQLTAPTKHEVTERSQTSVYEQRRQHLERECARLNYSRGSPELELIMSTKHHNIVFCVNPKVASTSLIRSMSRLFGSRDKLTKVDPNIHKNVALHLIRFSDVRPEVRARLLASSNHTFLFTREPLDRLVSAYTNKILDRDSTYKPLRRKILRRNRKPRTADVSFREFVDYILAHPANMDWHWRPQHEVCRPCAIHYNFIGRYESLSTDTAALQRIISPKYKVSLEVKNPSKKRSRSDVRLASLYKTLSPSHIRRLLQLYAVDYTLFGYEKPAFIG